MGLALPARTLPASVLQIDGAEHARKRGVLEEAEAEAEAEGEAEAVARPEVLEDDEDEEEALPHSEAVDVFQEGLAMVVQDPLLCDLPIQVRQGRVQGSFPAGRGA